MDMLYFQTCFILFHSQPFNKKHIPSHTIARPNLHRAVVNPCPILFHLAPPQILRPCLPTIKPLPYQTQTKQRTELGDRAVKAASGVLFDQECIFHMAGDPRHDRLEGCTKLGSLKLVTCHHMPSTCSILMHIEFLHVSTNYARSICMFLHVS